MATMRLIKENGLRGPRRSFGEKTHYLNLVLEHDRRVLHKNKKEFIQSSDLPPSINFFNITNSWT